MKALEEIALTLDELEALRLKDLLGLEQIECAARMDIAQSTLQRILVRARKKIVQALVEGKALRIEGGHYNLDQRFFCGHCRHRWGNRHGQAADQVQECPSCGEEL